MIRELDLNEMEEASGGAFNFAFGAVAGGLSYLIFNGVTGQDYSLAGFAGSVALGFATSGLSAVGTNAARAVVVGTVDDAARGLLAGSVLGTAAGARDPRSGGFGGASLGSFDNFRFQSRGGGSGGGQLRTGTVTIVDHN